METSFEFYFGHQLLPWNRYEQDANLNQSQFNNFQASQSLILKKKTFYPTVMDAEGKIYVGDDNLAWFDKNTQTSDHFDCHCSQPPRDRFKL